MTIFKQISPFFLTLLFFCTNVPAQLKQPDRAAYAEARKLYNELEKPISRSLLWEKTTQQQRLEAVKIATDLRDRTYKLWGDMAQCSMAAKWNLIFVQNLNKIALASQTKGSLNYFEMLAALREAEEFGSHRAACYDYVEALDAPAKK